MRHEPPNRNWQFGNRPGRLWDTRLANSHGLEIFEQYSSTQQAIEGQGDVNTPFKLTTSRILIINFGFLGDAGTYEGEASQGRLAISLWRGWGNKEGIDGQGVGALFSSQMSLTAFRVKAYLGFDL